MDNLDYSLIGFSTPLRTDQQQRDSQQGHQPSEGSSRSYHCCLSVCPVRVHCRSSRRPSRGVHLTAGCTHYVLELCGLNSPQLHRIHVTCGRDRLRHLGRSELEMGFVEENGPSPRVINNTLKAGQSMLVPEGLLHSLAVRTTGAASRWSSSLQPSTNSEDPGWCADCRLSAAVHSHQRTPWQPHSASRQAERGGAARF